MKQVKIIFGTDYELTWDVLDHTPAKMWFQMLEKELKDTRSPFIRFSGFLNGDKAEKKILNELQRHIDVINRDGRYKISEKATAFDQLFANKIHHHFEILAGSYDEGTTYYRESSELVKEAVDGLNHCIHDLEAWTRNKEYEGTDREINVFSSVIMEIRNCSRIHMPGAFQKYFTMNLNFGDMILHYSQIGKTWLEVFYDNDKEVFPEGIRPQFALSGEFDILFGNLNPDEKFLKGLTEFLEMNGKNIDDPALKLGHLPVAKMIMRDNWKTIKSEVGSRSFITRISTLIDGKETSVRNLELP